MTFEILLRETIEKTNFDIIKAREKSETEKAREKIASSYVFLNDLFSNKRGINCIKVELENKNKCGRS
jgi:hypothetical protein